MTNLKENAMSDLTPRERELVALGAALGSNCVPCIEYHIPQARKAGLTDPEIHAAVQQADRVRQVPARKVLEAALNLLPQAPGQPPSASPGAGCGCGSTGAAQGTETAGADRTMATMATMMSKMMSSWPPSRASNE
jgi:AhpD family alkylhydroperoxidase